MPGISGWSPGDAQAPRVTSRVMEIPNSVRLEAAERRLDSIESRPAVSRLARYVGTTRIANDFDLHSIPLSFSKNSNIGQSPSEVRT